MYPDRWQRHSHVALCGGSGCDITFAYTNSFSIHAGYGQYYLLVGCTISAYLKV